MTKILHVFDHSFPIGDGYAFRSGEIIRFARKRGLQTVHVTSAKQGAAQALLETVDGLDFHRTPPNGGLLGKLPVLDQWSIVSSLRGRLSEIVRSERPDLLHVHSPCLNGLAALPVAKKAGIPLLYEIRSLWEDAAVDSGTCREGDLRYRISRALENHVCRNAEHVVTICEGLREEFTARGVDPSRISVMPNSVDLDRFLKESSRDADWASRMRLVPGNVLGFIGTFFPFEGLEVLLRAVPAILRTHPHVRVLLVGDGPESARLQRLAADLGIAGEVIFTGRVPHAEVDRYYDLVDILVYPRIARRITELVTPLKPLEAMAKGKLVVASDVGGHREMVFAGQNGMLFRAGDPASLAQSCGSLLDSPESWPALRASGREYVAKARSWDVTSGSYVQLYEKLLHERRAGKS
jgi:PEP-CTERM/exosortase A-associated glycosyltransferase